MADNGRLTILSTASTVIAMRLSILTVFVLATTAFVSSCTVDTDIRIHDDASGEATITVRLHPVAVTYMSDLMISLGSENPSVFDRAAIERAFHERPGVTLREIEQIGSDTLRLDIEFGDVRRLFEVNREYGAPRGAPPVEFVQTPTGRTLSVRLSRSNFGYISGLFVMPESPLTVLLPYSEFDFMPRDEYVEVLEYALEDYLDGISVSELLEGERVRAIVRTDGEVTEIEGGVISSGRASFNIPILDVLTLEDEMLFTASW